MESEGKNPIVDWSAAIIAVLIAVMVLLSSCSPKVVHAPVEVAHERLASDSSRLVSAARDTVLHSDTVCITLSEKGDTMRLVQTRWRERVSLRVDTVVNCRVDSVYVESPVVVEVEKEPRKSVWDGLRDMVSTLVGCSIAVLLLWVIGKAVRKKTG